MKLQLGTSAAPGTPVAPRAGAWIETGFCQPRGDYRHVAPRAGAWIETCNTGGDLNKTPVAPRAGAWIETVILVRRCAGVLSPPARGRGLKHPKYSLSALACQSPPARGRGLKLFWNIKKFLLKFGRPPRGGVD